MIKIFRKPHRTVHGNYMIDSNSINARHKDEHMERIARWRENRVVEVIMPDAVVKEMQPYPLGAKEAANYIYEIAQPGEVDLPEDIRQAVFPDGYSKDPEEKAGQENDVRILASARKYGRTLITTDGASKRQPGGMLGHAADLAKVDVTVMRPEEAVAQIERLIQKRDELEREMAELEGSPVPEWVGKD